MAGLLYAGFDYGETADLPGIWDSAFGIVIDPTAGRVGSGCAVFDASLPSALAKAFTWGGTGDELRYTYFGFAFKPTSELGAAGVTLATISTQFSVFTLKAFENGALSVYQNSTLLCEAGPDLFALESGIYLEWRVRLQPAQLDAVQVRVNGLTVTVGALSTFTGGEAFASIALGGGATSSGTWLVDDVYVLDGKRDMQFTFGSRTIDNASFLGSVHVESVFATQDGFGIEQHAPDPDYFPWTPASGDVHFDQINEQPPDEDTYETTSQVGIYNIGTHFLDAYATYQFTTPYQGNGYGLKPAGNIPWELFAIQWVGRMSSPASVTVAATERLPTSTFPSANPVFLSDDLTVNDADFLYYSFIWDRDASRPPGDEIPWNFSAVFLIPGSPGRGEREFGATLT